MSRISSNTCLLVEELEGRSVPAALGTATSHPFDAAVQVASTPAFSDDIPLQVSLAAVVALSLCVGWDFRTHRRRRAAK